MSALSQAWMSGFVAGVLVTGAMLFMSLIFNMLVGDFSTYECRHCGARRVTRLLYDLHVGRAHGGKEVPNS